MHEIQEWAESLTSGQTITGRVLVVYIFVCNILAMILYIADTYSQPYVEECIAWHEKSSLAVIDIY